MNALHVISPYKYLGMWVFDDPAVDLVREPFISGADTMIDLVTADMPDAANGFLLIFSSTPFPSHQIKLQWRRGGGELGDWYYSEQLQMEGWLCPALLKYFSAAPKQIYVQVKPKR